MGQDNLERVRWDDFSGLTPSTSGNAGVVDIYLTINIFTARRRREG